MGTVAIDDQLLEIVEKMANARGLTLDAQAEELIAAGLTQRPSRKSLRAWAESIAAMTPKDIEQTDSVVLLREVRDR
jgi:hypothetical protein